MVVQMSYLQLCIVSIAAVAVAGEVHAQSALHRVSLRSSVSRFVPAAHASRATPAKPWEGPVVYAAPTSRGEVNVYKGGDKKPKQPIYSFSLDPGTANSLQVDAKGNLYLADTYSTWVFEYAPGTNTPLKGFPTSEPPDQIVIRGRTLYVFQSGTTGGDVSVQIYEKGSTSPTRSLSDASMEYPDALAVDKAGNVFVAYDTADLTSGVGEFVNGQMPMVPLTLKGISLPLSMAIDPAGNLVIDNASTETGSSLEIYPPGKSKPSAEISGLPWLYQFSFTADGTEFYAAPSGTGKKDQLFRKYDYPSGKLVYSYRIGDAFAGISGIAASPSAEPGTWGTQDK